MSKELVSCRSSDTIESVRSTMRERRIRRLPIVDEQNRPLGVLSVNDLARSAARGRTGERELVQMLATIGEPRFARSLESEGASSSTSGSLVASL
jgi:CBS domain-containing protein